MTSTMQPSMNQVLKILKKRENSLYNCLNSIDLDASFILDVAKTRAQLPIYANLRCGLWYIENAKYTCYFKSTDGHYGNWGFSTVRLNWHLALHAAEADGAFIVDATRRGKTFPVSYAPANQFSCDGILIPSPCLVKEGEGGRGPLQVLEILSSPMKNK